MAVYQISKIQIRRGKANSETGFPQLASGELGWAIDTQELYIGNGSISEGAPSIGKTKILTTRDISSSTGNVVSLLPYTYRAASNSPIVTGQSPAFPVTRTIQQRLDDNVTTADFATVTNGFTDNTIFLQRAIDQLFSNTTMGNSYDSTAASIATRITLRIPAGIYKITDTILIPSYTTLVGAGIDKTIIEFTQVGTAFRTIADVGSTNPINNPRNIVIQGMTISSPSSENISMDLTNVSDSSFTDIKLVGSWTTGLIANHSGIYLKNSKNNIFSNIVIKNFYSGVYGDVNANNNSFNNGSISICNYGISLGIGLTENGPVNTQFNTVTLTNITKQGIYIENGSENSFNNVTMFDVGGLDTSPVRPQIYVSTSGNSLLNLRTRRQGLMKVPSSILPRFVPIAVGPIEYNISSSSVNLNVTGVTTAIVRFPIPTDPEGVTVGTNDVTYIVTYSYKSNNLSRLGTMTIYIPPSPTNSNISLADDYSVSGLTSMSTLLEFNITLLNNNISLNYLNSYSGDIGVLTYKFSAFS